jgi:hypothetical protein
VNLFEPGLPRGPIVKSFREQIAAKHEQGKKADETLRAAILAKLNVTREAGLLLEQMRGTLRHREFVEATDFLGEDAVQAYLKFNRACPNPIDDVAAGLRSVAISMQCTGLLHFPHGHGPQHLHKLTFFSEATKFVQTLAASWAKFIKRKPLAEWHATEIDSLIATFAPVMKIYRTLNAEVQRRAGE